MPVSKHFHILQGAVAVDEASEVAKSVSAGSDKAILFVLTPMTHSNTDQPNVMQKRRTLEDTLMGPFSCKSSVSLAWLRVIEIEISTFFCFPLNILRSMDLSEVALCFADSHHAGDKRKRSQMCYSI